MSARDSGRLLLVVGFGRSGTSLLTGILSQLGLRVPQPEVEPDETNPRGFSEPRWVVDFHERLLRKLVVAVADGRPTAWDVAAAAARDEETCAELRAWLGPQLDGDAAVVVKDPRTSWFLPLWTRVASELGSETDFVTMLRHPGETVASAEKSYSGWHTPGSRTAGWINVSLGTELATRDARRAFVRYEDLLRDWRREVTRVGRELALPPLSDPAPDGVAAVDEFVDPSLHRNRAGWDAGLAIPARAREMADRVWVAMQPLGDPGGDSAETRARIDAVRAEYAELYDSSEAIALSSVTAARLTRKRPQRKPEGAEPKAATRPAQPAPAPAPSLRVRLARRVPKRYRRLARSVLPSSRD